MVTTARDNSASSSASRETSPLLLVDGRIIAGRYRLHQLLGKGAQGVVYRATQIDLDRPVALKLLREGVGEEARERFLLEARVTAEVRHPGVAVIFDAGLTEVGEPYYAMELLEGETLAARIDRSGPIPAAEIVPIVAGICSALDAVHGKKLIHRDVKPSNVFLARREDGGIDPKLIDFGIAKSTEIDAPQVIKKVTLKGVGTNRSPIKTLPGIIAGTPVYLSPEQIAGETADARSDLYALSVTLYEALTGTLPFDVPDTSELLVRILCEEPEPLEQRAPKAAIPAGVAAVVIRGLSKEPAARFANAGELANALWTALAITREVPAPEDSTPPVAPPEPSGRVAIALARALALAALILLLIVGARFAFRRTATAPVIASAPSAPAVAPPLPAMASAPSEPTSSASAPSAPSAPPAPASTPPTAPSSSARSRTASAATPSSVPIVSAAPASPPPSSGFRIDDLKTPF